MQDKIIQVSGFPIDLKNGVYILVALTENGQVILSTGDGKWASVGPKTNQEGAKEEEI